MRLRLRFFLGLRLGLFDFFPESMRDELVLWEHIERHLTGSVVRVFREVPFTRTVVLFLRVVALHMVRGMIPGVFVMVNTSVFIKVIIARVCHRIVIVVERSLVAFVLALLSDRFESVLFVSDTLPPLHLSLKLLRLFLSLLILLRPAGFLI